jgi:tetratricopeptide (TPR) repeat protein
VYVSTNTLLLLFIASLCMLIAAVTNGTIDPIRLALNHLQTGTPEERRQAAERLAQIGDNSAIHPLIQVLGDADPLVRETAERALWQIWLRSGRSDADVRLRDGMLLMQQGAFQQAVDVFTEVIEMAPDFAEAYNKRATTYYLMKAYEKSIRDCDNTLMLNPVHFGALSGAGLNYLALRNPLKALAFFERAVAINPNMPQIHQYINAIKNFLRDNTL